MDESTPLLGDGQGRKFKKDGKTRDETGEGQRTGEQSNSDTTLNKSSSRVDTQDIDVRFKRWIDHIKRKRKSTQLSPWEREAQFLISVFEPFDADEDILYASFDDDSPTDWPNKDGHMGDKDFEAQISNVRRSISDGLHPKMIQTGSSGSYFVQSYVYHQNNGGELQRIGDGKTTVAVFKPHDEEPYGDFNPKRVFLRRYLWWAMGRPCLIPSFSYLSEVGASLLDDRLKLGIVPSTRLVSIASESFFYPQHFLSKKTLPEKQGSYQNFLSGYVNVSTFLRSHPWPSRPKSLLERDLYAENTAHGRAKARARKGKGKDASRRKSSFKKVLSAISPLNCLAPIGFNPDYESSHDACNHEETAESNPNAEPAFEWSRELMQDFRLELEKLVCFDYLIRNTDRGLDNFMVKIVEPRFDENGNQIERRRLILAAIDNSLAFPWKHPAGIRSYPWGWLYLPTDLIGGPFSIPTRKAFIASLRSASWWQQTRSELEVLFRKDDHFDEKKFEGQMEILRGQGWSLLQSLRNEDEGPLELCARPKRMVEQKSETHEAFDLFDMEGFHHPLTPQALAIKARLLAQRSEEERKANANEALKKAAQPKAMPKKGIDVSRPTNGESDLQPMSMPETLTNGPSEDTNWPDHRQAHPHAHFTNNDEEQGPGNATLGRAYRGGSLGIDVLAEIDKSTARARRPRLRKSVTRGSSSSNLPKMRSPSRLISYNGSNSGQEEGIPELAVNGHTDEDTMISSVASLDNLPQSKTTRRRMGSVSDTLSFSAVFQSNSIQNDTTNIDDQREFQKKQRMKAIVEYLLTDDGVPWQTYLGLQ